MSPDELREENGELFTANMALADERDALRAELSTLKARRCDGCAHATPIPMQYRTPGPERWYWCGNAAKNGDDWGTFTTDGPFVVAASHSCAAWTEKP